MGAKKFSLVRNMGGGGEELTQTTPLSLNNTDLSHSSSGGIHAIREECIIT